MYQPHFHTTFNSDYETAHSPELRRMQLANHARREEFNLMIFSSEQRGRRHTPAISQMREHAIGRALNSIRDGIGGILISAGNRIQSA